MFDMKKDHGHISERIKAGIDSKRSMIACCQIMVSSIPFIVTLSEINIVLINGSPWYHSASID